MWSTFYFSALFIRLKLFKVRQRLICIDCNPVSQMCGERHCFLMCCLVPDSLIEMIKPRVPWCPHLISDRGNTAPRRSKVFYEFY